MRLLRGNNTNGCVGLDVDGSFISVVELGDGGVARAASADLPAGIVLEGEVADPGRLSGELKRLFKSAALPRRVWVGVANRHIALREFAIPKIDNPEHRESAVRYQAAESIVMPLEESVLDYQVVGDRETAQGATLERIVVVAARQTMVRKLVEAVRGAGLKPEGIDLSAFALVRALGAGDQDEEGGRVLCHLGGLTYVAIVEGTVCVFARPLNTTFDGQEIDTGALGEELRLSIDYHRGQARAGTVDEILLSGPGASVEGLPGELAEVLGLPVSVAPPLAALGDAYLPPGEDATRYTVSAGLAMGAAA
jgi:type IV pilus assembly protein PilM